MCIYVTPFIVTINITPLLEIVKIILNCDNFLMLKIEIYAILSKNTNLDLKVIVENLYFKDI